MIEKTISITLWGTSDNDYDWLGWYSDMNILAEKLGYKFTHMGVKSDSYDSGKVMTISRKEKEVIRKIASGENPSSMSLYCLPKDYKMAMFDYELLCARRENYITVVLKEDDFDTSTEQMILSIIKKHIDYKEGEIYLTSRTEVPMIYAETRDSENLDTYNSIRKI